MHLLRLILICSIAGAWAAPLTLGPSPIVRPPAIDRTGSSVVFSSTVTPDGKIQQAANLYYVRSGVAGRTAVALTSYTDGSGAIDVTISADGNRAAYTLVAANGGNELHLVDLRTNADTAIAIDREGCVQPAIACVNCFFPCVQSPHFSPDGSRVVFQVSRNEPFYVVPTAGGTPSRLPVYQGSLAAPNQPVITDSNQLVFTSSAPMGPTFAPESTQVYVIQLDGSGLRRVTQFPTLAQIGSANAMISRDGSAIVFQTNYDPQTNGPGKYYHWWRVKPDGTGLQQLTSEFGTEFLGLAPSGSAVAFVRGGQIYWRGLSGIVPARVLTRFTTSEAKQLALTEDGSRVFFNVGPIGGVGGAIYSINSNAGDLQPIYNPRTLLPNGIASSANGPAVAGSLISVYGLNLQPEESIRASSFPLPDTLGGLSLDMQGRKLPLLAVTPWQINAQLPPDVAAGSTTVTLQSNNQPTGLTTSSETKAIAPSAFAGQTLDNEGNTYVQAAVLHAGTARLAYFGDPVTPGEGIEIYATGLGATNPPVPAGTAAPSSPLAQTLQTPEVLIGEQRAEVLFSGLVPGLAGVYQINAVVPASVTAGRQPLALKFGEDRYSSGTIAVKVPATSTAN